MSKSKGNVVDPVPLAKRYGVDALRYFLLREVPFGADGVFTPQAFVERINADLANDLGNLLQRTLAMVQKYCSGVVPRPVKQLGEQEQALRQLVQKTVTKVEQALEELQFSVALIAIWELVRFVNKYIEHTTPWKLAQDPASKSRLLVVLYHLLYTLKSISILLQPFVPDLAARIWQQLGLSSPAQTAWEDACSFEMLRDWQQVAKGEVLFPRLELEQEIMAIQQMMA